MIRRREFITLVGVGGSVWPFVAKAQQAGGSAMFDMRRREFITLLTGTAAMWPLVALAQVSPKQRPVIAWLSGGISKGLSGAYPPIFLEGMREFGYAEGRDFKPWK